jgi:hypothetical protein
MTPSPREGEGWGEGDFFAQLQVQFCNRMRFDSRFYENEAVT